jgi:hypothetical protein
MLRVEYIDSDNAALDIGAEESGWHDGNSWSPADKYSFILFINVCISYANQKGCDRYKLTVCTKDQLNKADYVVDVHRSLIVPSYDWQTIRRRIFERVASCEGRTLEESLRQLRNKFLWEFEGLIVE